MLGGGEILQIFKILDVWLAKMFSKLFHSGKVIFGGGGWAKICKILQVFLNFLCVGGGEILQSFKILDVWVAKMFSKFF